MTISTPSWVDVPGARLHVLSEGDGPPVVLVHAGIVDLRAWDALVPLLVGAGHRVIRYDIRSFGRSSTEDVAFSNRADLVAVLDHAGVQRAMLVGNSYGATVCLDTLVEHPDRVAGLVWVNGWISGFDAEGTPEEQALFEALEAAEEAHDADAAVDLDLRIWVDGIGQPTSRVPAAVRDAVAAMDRPLYRSDRVTGRPIPLDPPALGRLGSVSAPVLAVLGALDTSDTRAAAEHLAASVPGARLEVVPDVAHMVGMEAPERLAASILGLARATAAWA